MDTYLAIADTADSFSLTRRVAACAAQQGAPGDPSQWAVENRLDWASAPGWGAAWDSAVAGGVADPGADPAVITDGQILAQVQSMLGSAPAGDPTTAWPTAQIVAWLAVRGVVLTPDALEDLDKAELLALVANLLNGADA